MKGDLTIRGFGTLAIAVLFFLFWAQSGWYRLDCALGVTKACDLISQEYVKKAQP